MAQSGEAPAQSMAEHVQETTSTEVPLHRWVLKYGDKVYGPYTFEAMKGYVAEGRVAEHSLIAPEGTPAGASMWQYAVDIPAFTPLFAVTPEEQTLPAGEPTAENTEAATDEPAGETTDMHGDAPGDAVAADEPAQQPAAALRRPTPEPAAEGQRPAYGPGKGQIDRRRQPDTANFIIVMDIKARFAGPLEQAHRQPVAPQLAVELGGLPVVVLDHRGFGEQADGTLGAETERFNMGERIREVEQGPDGALWLLEDGSRGRPLKLTPADANR